MNKKPEDNVGSYPAYIDTRVALLEMSISHINDTLVRIEKRFYKIDERLDKIDDRFNRLDEKIDKLDSKLDSRFLWLLSFTIGGFASVLGVVARVAHWI